MQTIQITEKILKKIDASNTGGIVPLTEYTPYFKPGYRILSESISIKELQVRSFIKSLPTVPFPLSPLEASESEVQLQMLRLEWGSPRIHLNLLIKSFSVDWLRIGMISLLNSSPSPYREFFPKDLNLGNNGILGIQAQNVGFGLLQGQDVVTIIGDLVRNITLEKVTEGINRDATINSMNPTLIMGSNAERIGFTIYNESNTDVYVDITPDVSAQFFLIRLLPESFYESNFPITDAIYMISLSGYASVNVREF